MVYLEDNELLVDEQNGFRRHRSCLYHIFSLNSVIQNNNSTFVTFIDLQKAFDTVDRELLPYCLLTHGIDGNFYHSIKLLYSNTESCVRLNDKYTDRFRCSVGVRQGDNLSPTLFALSINDLAVKLKTLNKGAQINNYNPSLLIYADDIALISHSENDMQHMLDTVDAWCRKWRLRINSQKSKVVHFRKNRSKRSNFNFHLGENNLDYEASYKYLGVIFDEKRGFKVNAENLAMSGGRALGSVISKINAIKSVGFRTYEKLFNNCVAPVLDYSSGVWGHKKHHCIEMVQNRALRYILGIHQFTPLLAVQGESGWLSGNCRHKMNMLRLWNRLIYMENERITKRVFLWDREQNNSSNWSSQVKNIMESLNIESTYFNSTPCNLHYAEEKLRTNFETEWHNDIQSIPKLHISFLNPATQSKNTLR